MWLMADYVTYLVLSKLRVYCGVCYLIWPCPHGSAYCLSLCSSYNPHCCKKDGKKDIPLQIDLTVKTA